jgi:copper chaperone CopZ
MSNSLTYLVPGMTCDHCTVAVADEVTKVGGVAAVDVDLQTQARADPRDRRRRGGRRGRHRRGRLRRSGGMRPATKHFIRHYVEMVVAMFLGMAVLGIPAGWAMGVMGIDWSALTDDEPALMFLGMATTMTVPMVGWMRYRGHGWRANTEMSASMFVPTFAVIALLWAELLTDVGVLMIIEHVAMLLAMAGAMLLRPAEYTRHHGHRTHVESTDAGPVTA